MEARRRDQERRETQLESVERERTPAFGAGPYATRDLIHWGPVWAGVIGGFAVMILLSLLGLAIGLAAAPDPAAIADPVTLVWGVIILVIAYFIGGWVAGRTSSYRGTTTSAFFIGSMVWALSVVFVMLLATLGLAGAFGAAFGFLGVAFQPGQLAAVAQDAALWAFIGLIVAYVVTVAGAAVGSRSTAPEDR